jgi:hypothetical protein
MIWLPSHVVISLENLNQLSLAMCDGSDAQSKMNEARDEMRRKADSIEKAKLEQRRQQQQMAASGYDTSSSSSSSSSSSGYGSGSARSGGSSSYDDVRSSAPKPSVPTPATVTTASSWDKPYDTMLNQSSHIHIFCLKHCQCSDLVCLHSFIQKNRRPGQGYVLVQGQEIRRLL